MFGPQAATAAGGVKGVGLELTTVIVDCRERHVEPAETVLSTVLCDCFLSGTFGLK